MIRSRIFAIACGYEDCDDFDTLRHDPALKIACERLPDSGCALASQPSLSRLENTPSWRQLARMGLSLIDLFCDSFGAVPGHITLDIDDTCDRTHTATPMATSNCPCSTRTPAVTASSRSIFTMRRPASRSASCCGQTA